jgi:hypothetical protein
MDWSPRAGIADDLEEGRHRDVAFAALVFLADARRRYSPPAFRKVDW